MVTVLLKLSRFSKNYISAFFALFFLCILNRAFSCKEHLTVTLDHKLRFLKITTFELKIFFFNKGDKNQSKFIKNLFILNLKSISIKRSSSVNDSIKSVKF